MLIGIVRGLVLVLGMSLVAATVVSAIRTFVLPRSAPEIWNATLIGSDRAIADPQCGFRVYPLAAALAARARGDHMEFDLELPVRMVWAGTPVRNLPTRVRYLSAAEGGVSHFHVVRDTARISWLHARLALVAAARALAAIARSRPAVR